MSKFDIIHQLFPNNDELRKFYDVITKIESKVIILDRGENPPWVAGANDGSKHYLPYGFGCLDFPITLGFDHNPDLHQFYTDVSYDDNAIDDISALDIDTTIDGMIVDKILDPLDFQSVRDYKMIYIPIHSDRPHYFNNDSTIPVTYISTSDYHNFITSSNKKNDIPIYRFVVNYGMKVDELITLNDLEPTQYNYNYFCLKLSDRSINVWDHQLKKMG